MWELDYKESWALKNWCFSTVVLEKTLESPLDCKEIQPVPPKGNQSWVFIGRTDAKAETPVLWPPHVKSWLFGKDSEAGRDGGACGPLSMGLHRVGHDWSNLAAAAAAAAEVSETVLSSFHSFLLYSALQKLFPPFYLPAHWFILLLQVSAIDSF